MSQYGTIYRLQWNTVPSLLRAGVTVPAQAMTANIFDTEDVIDDADTPTVIQLQASANPLVIKIINNDEDKFSPIRAKQAVITFKSALNQFQDASTFADSSDNRWYVEITADGTFVFKGFLMLTDSQQDHLPDPNDVVLTASDHLALLKDIPLQTDTGENPSGKYRIAELIALCLKGTGLTLGLTVINNLRHGGGSLAVPCTFNNPSTISGFADTSFFYTGQVIDITFSGLNDTTTVVTGKTETTVTVTSTTLVTDFAPNTVFTDATSQLHFYDGIYLDAKTFESAIGISEDCYSVLEKILGEDCFLTQWQGSWYIMRVDEYDGNPIYPATFDTNGGFISFDAATSFSKSIGANENRRLVNADALRRYDRPHLFVKETFDLQFPEETICNIDYDRGDETADAAVQRSGYTAYELDGWDAKRLWGSLEAAPNFTPSIQRSFNLFGDEETRFIMLSVPASPTGAFEYIRSCAVPMSYLDRFKFTFDVAAMQGTSGDGSILVAMIILYGIDGSVWVLREPDTAVNWENTLGEIDTQWKLSNEDVTLFRNGLNWSIFDDADHPAKTEWVPCVMNAAPLPVDGDVYFHLFSANQQAGTYDDFDIKYQNIDLEYRPYIGGSYLKYKKHYHKVTRDPIGYFNARRDRIVYISDSPKPLFKGAMFFHNGIRYVLTLKWYTASTTALGPPIDQTYTHPYGYIQAFSVWNQYRNANRIFSTSVLGLGSMWVDALDKISLTDNNPNTNNRYFLLISFEQDWKTALWSGVFIEDYRTDLGKVYDDDHEAKFIT